MQPLKILDNWLFQNTKKRSCLFKFNDMRALFPDMSDTAYKTLISRAAKTGVLTRICRGIYLYKKNYIPDGLLLYKVATLLRRKNFNYASLETVLSDAGVISQMPINWICVMTSGRSNIVSCKNRGTIEFIHTNRSPNELIEQLYYDGECGMWRAKVPLALEDMKRTKRSLDLIDWEEVNEFI